MIAKTLTTRTSNPVRLVLFDAFDTLITPRAPIHLQYAEEAVKAGLKVTPEAVKEAFKSAFKKITKLHPDWGLHSIPPMNPAQWWTLLIEECMRRSGVPDAELSKALPNLASSLLNRFQSKEGYKVFDDVRPCLLRLRELGVSTGIISNADDHILRTLENLELLPKLISTGATISRQVGVKKPDSRIFQLACHRAGLVSDEESDQGNHMVNNWEGVLMIGDELEADYQGALRAGLEPRLLRRLGRWSEGAKRQSEEAEGLQEKGVEIIRSLEELVQEVEERNL